VVRATVLLAGGFLAALTVVAAGGCAVAVSGSPASPRSSGASAAGCTADAISAIRARRHLTGVPAACQGLSPSQRNAAVGLAIRLVSASASKSVTRRRAGWPRRT
jgi:hypothetical protein